jgi:hypothetical protein
MLWVGHQPWPAISDLNAESWTGMTAHLARTLGLNTRKRERVRCSSLIDWPVYPRLAHTMWASNGAQCGQTLASEALVQWLGGPRSRGRSKKGY